MKNCFFCNNPDCSQAGIDGMWGDYCQSDLDVPEIVWPDEEEDWHEDNDDVPF